MGRRGEEWVRLVLNLRRIRRMQAEGREAGGGRKEEGRREEEAYLPHSG